jgi:hypothetical protein
MRKENNTDKYRKLTKQKATKVARLCFIDSAEKEEPGCTQLIRQSTIYFFGAGCLAQSTACNRFTCFARSFVPKNL